MKRQKKKLASFFVTLTSESFFINIWYWLANTIFYAKTILTGDVNLVKPDLSNMVRVQIFISRYFSRIYFAVVAEEIQNTHNLISRFMFVFSMLYKKIVRLFFQSWLFFRFGLDCKNKIQKRLSP